MRPSLCWDVCKIPVTNHQPLGHLNNCHPSLPSNPFSNTTGGTVMCGIFTSSSAMGTKLSSEPKLSSPYLIQAPELLACPPPLRTNDTCCPYWPASSFECDLIKEWDSAYSSIGSQKVIVARRSKITNHCYFSL